MRKTIQFLVALLIGLTIGGTVLADSFQSESVYIKKAGVYTRAIHNDVKGEVMICNEYNGRTSFELNIYNSAINKIYRKKMTMSDSGCETFRLKFTDTFAEMAKEKDPVRFYLRNVKNILSGEGFRKGMAYKTFIKNGDAEVCVDSFGGDDVYDMCKGGFVTHLPTGTRIRVMYHDYKMVDISVTNILWGGTEDVRIYKGRTKKIIAQNADATRLNITYVGRSAIGNIILELESES